MELQSLKKHSDLASNAEFIELPNTYYNHVNDTRFDVFNKDIIAMAGTSTNTIMSQKTPGWDGDSDND
jgi:hypothetical protein